MGQPLFIRNDEGRIVRLENSFILFPGMENGLRILFGGKVLELMDEVSGTLANLYLAEPGFVAVHAGEEVLFLEPIRASEMGKVVAQVVLVTEKIICVYIEVWGGRADTPDAFSRRYAGFGLCAVVDKDGAMVHALHPWRDSSPLADLAEQVVAFQKSLRSSVRAIRQ